MFFARRTQSPPIGLTPSPGRRTLTTSVSVSFQRPTGLVACDIINKLSKLAAKGKDEAKKVLAAYVQDGPVVPHR